MKDLLTLSEIEDAGTKLELQNVDLIQLIKNLIELFKDRIEEKGLEFNFVQTESDLNIKIDQFRFEQAIINLIDNAIKYTDSGQINISLQKNEKNAVIKISDTGLGIPIEDQARIFERFYIVDKSRSRRVGGTGLGLSIVKHIILLHNGEINLQSQPNSGSCFTIKLPLEYDN